MNKGGKKFSSSRNNMLKGSKEKKNLVGLKQLKSGPCGQVW